MRLSLNRHVILIPLISRELISSVVFGAQEREHVIPFLLNDRASITDIESAGLGIGTAAELMEAHGSHIMTREDICAIRDSDGCNLVINDGIAQERRIESDHEAIINTRRYIEEDIHLLLIRAGIRQRVNRSLEQLVDRKGEVYRTIASMDGLEHNERIDHRFVILAAIDRDALVRTDRVMTILVLRSRIDIEEERRGRVTTCKILIGLDNHGIGVIVISCKLDRVAITSLDTDLSRLRNDIRCDEGIDTRTIAGVISSDIGGIGDDDGIAEVPCIIGRRPSGSLRRLAGNETMEGPASGVGTLGSMGLRTIELIHDVRCILELQGTAAVSRHILDRIFRNRETRLRSRRDLEIAVRLLDEANAAGIFGKRSIHDEGTAVRITISRLIRIVILIPIVGKSFRCGTLHVRIVTAVFSLNMCVSAVHGEVGIAEVATPVTVHGRETDFDILSVVGLEVDTDGSPIFPCHITGHIPSRFGSIRIVELGITAGSIDELAITVQDFHLEFRLFVVARIFEHDGILNDQDTLVRRIDEDIIGDRLRFVAIIPVTEADRSQGAVRHCMQHIIRSRIGLRRIDMEGMSAGLRLRSIIDDTHMGIGVFALVARIITIGTGHLRCIMEVDIVDTVVIRTIDEDIGVIDVACDESVILTANTHVVAALEDRPYEIGIVRRRTGHDVKALVIGREITEGVRPVEFTGLAILDIECSGVHTIP